ncbi:helix-turn-helix domain-containing protein [Thermanaerosceptrum fracticalcis]|uniref:Helix-turn-helix domain-containing protein n=1 Tax=Thermanaerosceptrum fracticalcis TaxID=1712410 RepID=A0A7G6E1C2_THEFR|nr:helix-turn-helix transcriptional regulator [Thermanaerosceptrum fracticalcis]QNB45876.1 helix-turn-helix domain-containing protein [Thermanaerosceptrum fracticalcis]
MPSFGERLSELRKEKGLSQQELADLFEVSKSAIAMYETDRREPDNETLKKFATFFDVSTDYLLGRTDERRPAEQIIEDVLPITDPLLDDLLKKVPDLTDEEKESLAEHMQFALKIIEKERQKRAQQKKDGE